MEKNYNIDDELIDSLKGLPRATAPAFFYTRLMARIEKERQQSPIIRFLTHPAFAMSIVALVITLNIVTFANMNDMNNDEQNIQEAANQFASEYNVTNYSVYEEISND